MRPHLRVLAAVWKGLCVVLPIAIVYYLLAPWLFWLGVDAEEWKCGEEAYVGLALGFWYDGEIDNAVPAPIREPVIEPGKGNENLARWLSDHAGCLSAVYTQRAISDVWLGGKTLSYADPHATERGFGVLDVSGLKVYQMHSHDPQAEVRTFEALRCALDRVGSYSGKILLVAHSDHFERAFDNLATMFPEARIVNPMIRGSPYPDAKNTIQWAIWNAGARAKDLFAGSPNCRPEVALDVVN